MSTRQLTLLGDRQAGKTHLLLDIATENAEAGKTVLFESESVATAENTFNRCVKEHARYGWPGHTVEKVLEGKREILFESGGRIVFESAFAYSAGRYKGPVDVHLIDDTSVAVARDDVDLVIRAVLR